MKNIDVPIFTVDFEGSKEVGVVEYGIVEISRGKISATHTAMSAPKHRRNKEARTVLDISGISESQLENLGDFDSNISIFKDMRRRGLFAAHNAAFEDSILRSYLPSPGEVPHFIEPGKRVYTWGLWLDSMCFVKNLYPSLESVKLSDAINALGIKGKLDALAEIHCPRNRRKWHCALYDALASAAIFTEVCAQPGFEDMTLEWLSRYSGNSGLEQKELGL